MKIGIVGYGNLGRAIEYMAEDYDDIEIAGVFTRRDADAVRTRYAKVYSIKEIKRHRNSIDTLILCHGSSQDLPIAARDLIRTFNIVDTYDNHSRITEHKADLDSVARACGRTAIVSLGWDPGLLSAIRLLLATLLPSASVNTFWGRGVSQGHSEAIRRIPGVIKALEYTVPRADALTLASLVCHRLEDTDRHKRVCYIAVEKGREDSVRRQVLSMENYFLGYDTEIHFLDEHDPLFDTATISHRGRIYALGKSGVYCENKHSAFFDLDIGSNPELTAHIALVGARVSARLSGEKKYGCYTILDLPLAVLCESCGINANNYL